MSWFASFTLNHLLDFDELRSIRDDWVEIYYEAYESDEFESRYGLSSLDAGELKQRAITSMEKAGQYRPHQNITGTVERITGFYSILRLALLLGSVIASTLLFGVFDVLLALTTRFESIIISTVPTDIWVLLMLFFHLLQTDNRFVQEFNKKMRFGPKEIVQSQRDSKELFGYYLWNDGLCNPKKAPALLILLLFRILSEQIYDHIISTVKNNLERFLDVQTFRKGFSRAFEIELKQDN